MSTPHLTEERLRTWTTSQDDRERMCIGILALDPRFTDVKPRRPKGGPDGGRDIEAVFDNRAIVWGGVGFRTSVTDSNEDKRWVENKFKCDLNSAKSNMPTLWGFVFFTNVDLKPSEVRKLELYAVEQGLSFVEIFYRERLRIALDSPRGLALRYQHLSISLSEPEQAAFFAEYGSQIESLLHKGFGAIDERLRRIEFLHNCSKPLITVGMHLVLKQSCSPEKLGHFRFLAQILNMRESDPHPTLWIAGRDAYPVWHGGKQSQPLIGVKHLVWSRNPDESIQNTVISLGEISINELESGGYIYEKGPYKTLGDLDGHYLSIYVTNPLFELIEGIYIIANEYVIAGEQAHDFVKLDGRILDPWPEELSDVESSVPWVTILLKMEASPPGVPQEFARTSWNLSFSYYTPQKLQS